MKYYQSCMMIAFLSCSLQADAAWFNWINAITARIHNTTDVILHKEFSHAKRLELNNACGTIVINSWKQNSIAIEVITSCAETSHKDVKVNIDSLHDVIKIHTLFAHEKVKASVVFNILVPKDVDLIIATHQGDIIIKDMHSNLDVQTLDGNIKLVNPHNMLYAKSEHGNILIRTDSIDTAKEFTLIADHGDIEIYTTSAINTYIDASAPEGKIVSDLPITLTSQTTILNADTWKRFRQYVNGSIGNPLSKLSIIAYNGSIAIMPYIKQNDIF